LSDTEFKSNGLINLMEETSRQHSIQAWLLLAAFSQIFSKNFEQKGSGKI
jgi:hypothetical protein